MPEGARVSVDTVYMGKTPLTVQLTRKHEHLVRIGAPGYESAEFMVTRYTSGWLWGSAALFLPVALIFDAVTGAGENLSVEQLYVNLKKDL